MAPPQPVPFVRVAASRPSRQPATAQWTSRVATARLFQASRAKPGRPIGEASDQLSISANRRAR